MAGCWVRALGAALLAGGLLAPPASDASQRPIGREAYEARLFQLVNAERARHGLPRLARGRCATGHATTWAERIARDRSVRHQSLRRVLSVCGVRRAAENVAMGAISPDAMMRLWMKSRRHRANVLDRRVTHLGVGARPARDGNWYAVQLFLGY